MQPQKISSEAIYCIEQCNKLQKNGRHFDCACYNCYGRVFI